MNGQNKAVANGPSGREGDRLAWFSVFGLWWMWAFIYVLADIMFTLRWTHDKEEQIHNLVQYAVGWVMTDTALIEQRAFLLLMVVAAVAPTVFQVVGGGVKSIKRRNPVTIPLINISGGIIWVMIVLVGTWDTYTDFIAYRTMMDPLLAAGVALVASVGLEIVGVILFVYLWENKYVLSKSEREMERDERRKEIRREKHGVLGLIPSWVIVSGLAIVSLGAILGLAVRMGVVQ